MRSNFPAKFQKIVPRDYLPLFIGVKMLYLFVENLRFHSSGSASGHAKAKRKRVEVHDGERLAKNLHLNEWTEPRPELVSQTKLRTRTQ